MAKVQAKKGFRVVIVGGGIAGLTLAIALQKANIDYILLESKSVIDPDLGASIGIQPQGGRILDQIGCWDEILTLVEPLRSHTARDRNGNLIGKPSDIIDLMVTR
jgi:2-polyprenyl-6-methoxyphenol hydroxylase-like FAD-dependent oxidoreductase